MVVVLVRGGLALVPAGTVLVAKGLRVVRRWREGHSTLPWYRLSVRSAWACVLHSRFVLNHTGTKKQGQHVVESKVSFLCGVHSESGRQGSTNSHVTGAWQG